MTELRNSQPERTVLVGLVCGGERRTSVEDHLDELARLVDTAGGTCERRLLQERPAPDPATMVGPGFVARLAEVCLEVEAQAVVFDEDLTGSQVRNLERLMPDGVKVLDRAGVILDIFAQRARTREAQTQVELAQLTYLLPRLTRRWGHLSRQAGGIGTRGVGETQLEIDRRLVSRRIGQLRRKLDDIEHRRRLRRQRREATPTVALVGYTNAGKSSLFRKLTRADVLVEDRLFATLDARARKVTLGDGVAAVLTDTVGFIRKLPHHLVAPFRSTLEEAGEAELVLHVVDSSHAQWREHLRVGEEVLEDLGVERNRTVVVLNKIDLDVAAHPATAGEAGGWLRASAVTGEGLPALRRTIRRRLLSAPGVAVLRIPLEDVEMVRRVLELPHQVARRFGREAVEVAVKIADERLLELGLSPFAAAGWREAGPGRGAAGERR